MGVDKTFGFQAKYLPTHGRHVSAWTEAVYVRYVAESDVYLVSFPALNLKRPINTGTKPKGGKRREKSAARNPHRIAYCRPVGQLCCIVFTANHEGADCESYPQHDSYHSRSGQRLPLIL